MRDRREDAGQYFPGGKVVSKTPTGQGEGGTSDYDQLANKPKINDHELTGNKTAAQLGLATPSDIPDVLGKLPLRALPKYLHYLAFDDTYPADAAWLYGQLGPSDMGRCSAVRRGGKLFRKYDWTFDDAAEFAVKMSGNATRFASTGMASVGSRLTENDVMSAVNSRYYKCLPGMTLDGINEKGVVCEINVDGGPKTGWHGDADDDGIHILAAVRWVLDHGETAAQAASWIADHIIQPQGEMNFHFMVADAEKTYIVENGEAHDVTDGTKVLTNYALYDEAHAGGGKERYNLLAGGTDISAVNFTNAYRSGNDWDSDFESAAQHTAAIEQWAAQGTDKEAHRGKTTSSGKAWWQSVHTTEYDFAAKTMKVAVQEQDDWYVFAVGQANVETDDAVTRASANPVKSSGIWSAIWGALTAIPSGFSSFYDWCSAKLAGKRDKTDLAVYELSWDLSPLMPYLPTGDHNWNLRVKNAYDHTDPESPTWALHLYDGDTLFLTDRRYTITSGQNKKSIVESWTEAVMSDHSAGIPEITVRRNAVRPVSPADSLARVSQIPTGDALVSATDRSNWNGKMDKVIGGSDYPIATLGLDGLDNSGVPIQSILSDIANLGSQKMDKPTQDFPGIFATVVGGAVVSTGVGENDVPLVTDIIDPALAEAVGKIADAKLTRDFVNLMVSTNSAHYLTARAWTAGSYTYPPFASAAALRAALAAHTEQNPQFFYAGEAFTPTKNDWVIVSEDEDHPLGTIIPASRYGFVGTFGSGGSFQYQVSYKLPLTTAQIAALDSGATSTRLSGLETDGTATDTFATDLIGKPVANVKANTVSLAAAYSETATYAVGDAVTHDGKLYKCNTAITTAEAWTPAHWTETTVATLWNNADTTSYGGQN